MPQKPCHAFQLKPVSIVKPSSTSMSKSCQGRNVSTSSSSPATNMI